MTSTLRGGGGLRWKWDVTGHRGWGVKECSGRQILTFLLKKIEFAPWPDIKLSQRLIYYWQEIFVFDSDVRQRSHTLMIPLHCLWAKSNNRTRGCDVTLFLFWFRSCTCKERLHYNINKLLLEMKTDLKEGPFIYLFIYLIIYLKLTNLLKYSIYIYMKVARQIG